MELVKVKTSDGILLNGINFKIQGSSKSVLYFHGYGGDILQARFVSDFAENFNKSGFNFITAGMRGKNFISSCLREAGEKIKFEVCGSAVERFADSYADIAAWVDFVKKSSNEIILLGHSLGCHKILNYLKQSSSDLPSVLLAPPDIEKIFHKLDSFNEIKKEALDLSEAGKGAVLLDEKRAGRIISAQTFIDYLRPSVAKLLQFSGGRVKVDCSSKSLVIIGLADRHLGYLPSEIDRSITADGDIHFSILEDCGHSLAGNEKKVFLKIDKWIKNY
jgi:hypothetical protein